jgi:DNA-binding winged helix-turn-helix (wHTH) protein/tetratricopeptide (TPR) repeat protein
MGAEVVYRFEGGELDGAGHRLLVDGQPVELEPKAFAVLEDLLAHAGTMRSHDELLDAVWGHRHVTPAVLNRCIGLVRKALGDHADAPRYIQTVHTLGYRFIAPVEVEGTVAQGSAVHGAAKAAPASRPRKHLWVIAAGIAVLALLGGLAWRSRDGAPGSQAAPRPPTHVVLVPFDIPPQAAELTPQVRALEASVVQRLRMLPGLRIERGAGPRDGGAVALVARVEGKPAQWTLHVRVRNASAPFERAYPLQLTHLGETSIAVQGDIVRLLRPDSAELLEPSGVLDAGEFVRGGLRARAGLKRRDQQDAIAAFRRALQIDPTNADAWCFLGGMYLRPSMEFMASKDSTIPPASEAIARGLRLDPASANCLAMQGALLREQGRLDESEAAFRRAYALEPSLVSPRAALANIELERGHFRRYRDALEQMTREHPEVGWNHFKLVDAYTITGEPEKGRALAQIAEERFPDLRDIDWPLAALELMYGHPADAIRRYDALSEFDPDDRSYRLNAAYGAAWICATAKSKEELDRAGYIDTAQYLMTNVWLFYALDDPKGALAWLRNAKVSPSSAITLHALQAQSLALAGDRAGALREYARVYEDGWRDADPAMADTLAHFGAQMLNYAALLPEGAPRKDLVDAAARQLDTMRANGFGLPWVHYQAAQIALMRGDRPRAMASLDAAIDAGFTDLLALSRDLPWRAVAGDPAFEQRKARLSAIAAEQRKALAVQGSGVVAR